MSFAKKINKMLSEVTAVKSASTVAGTDAVQDQQDPGFVRGQTSHPSKDVDAGTMPAKIGFRGAEYEADIKRDQPVGVDSLSPSNKGGDQDSRQLNIGMRQSAVGEDPSVEKRYKGKPDDSPTTSPANVEEIGQKYASMGSGALIKLASAKLSAILAMVIADQTPTSKTAAAAAAPAGTDQEAYAAGRQLADIAIKQASQAPVNVNNAKRIIADVTRDAMAKAAAVVEYVRNFAQLKKAADEMPPENMVPPPGEGTEGGMGGGMEGMNGGGGAGMGGEMPPMPPMPEHGSDSDGDMGGMPGPAGEEHSEGGEGDDGHGGAVDELVSSLIEAGISPEDLLAAVSDEAGDSEGEGPTKMASAMKLEDRYEWKKLAKSASARHRTPKFRYKVAQPGSEHRAQRDRVIAYIQEVCKR